MTASLLDLAASRLWLPLVRRRHGDRSYDHVTEVEALNRADAATIAAHQLDRVRAICAEAAAHSPFYRQRFARAGITSAATMTLEEFSRIPPLTRDELRDNLDAIRHERFPKETMITSATGGTTFAPVRFYLDRKSYFRRRAATIALDRWYGYEPGRRIAFLWGARQDFPPDRWKSRLRSEYVDRTRYYPSLPLDHAILERYIRDLQAFAPALVQGYPLALDIMGRFLLERGRTLPVSSITCTAEPLLGEHARTIEQAFGVRPFNWYGSRDIGRGAGECEQRDGMHINAYGLFVEAVPLAGAGPEGPRSLVVTDLWNEGFPLIRYDTEDLGTITEQPCRCGRHLPRIEGLTGRVGDVFVNSAGQLFPPTGLRPGFPEGDDTVMGIQIVQHAPNRFEAVVVPGRGYDATRARHTIEASLADLIREPVTVTLQTVSTIPRESSGKFRSMKRTFPLPFNSRS